MGFPSSESHSHPAHTLIRPLHPRLPPVRLCSLTPRARLRRCRVCGDSIPLSTDASPLSTDANSVRIDTIPVRKDTFLVRINTFQTRISLCFVCFYACFIPFLHVYCVQLQIR